MQFKTLAAFAFAFALGAIATPARQVPNLEARGWGYGSSYPTSYSYKGYCNQQPSASQYSYSAAVQSWQQHCAQTGQTGSYNLHSAAQAYEATYGQSYDWNAALAALRAYGVASYSHSTSYTSEYDYESSAKTYCKSTGFDYPAAIEAFQSWCSGSGKGLEDYDFSAAASACSKQGDCSFSKPDCEKEIKKCQEKPKPSHKPKHTSTSTEPHAMTITTKYHLSTITHKPPTYESQSTLSHKPASTCACA